MGLPEKITLVEVGPRDGFQNVKELIPAEDKIAIIQAMMKANVRQMEITSFVNPKWVSQMADAGQVAGAVLSQAPEGFRAIALTPNRRGVENAVRAGMGHVTYVVSASETHNQRNVNRSVEASLKELREIRSEFPDICVRVSLATSFGCPFEGEVSSERVLYMIDQILSAGVQEIILCDTIGVANPLQVQKLLREIKKQMGKIQTGLHFHDTRGLGLSNIYAGLLEGITIFETSIGGLGGCPFAPGSAGNTATEDLLNMLDGMGISHGINTDAYMQAVALVKEKVKAPLTGRIVSMCRTA